MKVNKELINNLYNLFRLNEDDKFDIISIFNHLHNEYDNEIQSALHKLVKKNIVIKYWDGRGKGQNMYFLNKLHNQ